MAWIQDGTRITGTYCGVAFAGLVESSRAHSMSREQILNITLDAPITVFSAVRENLNECPISMICCLTETAGA